MNRVPAVAIQRGRLADSSAAPEIGESNHTLGSGPDWRIEQILSGRLADPIADRLDHDEWVVVLSGAALLDVDGLEVALSEGDWVHLRAGVPHRVVSTEPPTSWLAVHAPGS
jgi:cupin 2 domain-containing protein